MNAYSIFDRATGEWLGEVRGVDSATDARHEWVESHGTKAGYTLERVAALTRRTAQSLGIAPAKRGS